MGTESVNTGNATVPMPATLALRASDYIVWLGTEVPADAEKDDRVFAVALVGVPKYPGNTNLLYGERPAVVCITFFPKFSGWGFVHLEPETKQYLGEFLQKLLAPQGQWIFMRMTDRHTMKSV